jgi:hypothetical protein
MKRAVWASLFIAAFALGATLMDTSVAQAQRRDGAWRGGGGAWRGRPYYGGYVRGGYYPGYAAYGYPYAYGGYPYYNGYYGGYYGAPAYGYVGTPGVAVGVGRRGVGFGFGWW